MDEYDQALSRLGITLPESARRHYELAPELKYLQAGRLESLTTLDLLYPAIPARLLPLFLESCGDLLGVYFPRWTKTAVVVGFDHEESVVKPLSLDIEGLFKDPDSFVFNDPTEPRRVFWEQRSVVKSLLIRPDAENPERELLKPFAFHYRALEARDAMFNQLIARFGSPGILEGLIRESFPDGGSLQDRTRWMTLARRLADSGLTQEAIQAIDNCHTLHFIYPTYGEPYKKNPGVSWKKTLELLEQLHPLVERHGDGLDRETTAHRLRIVREYVRDHPDW